MSTDSTANEAKFTPGEWVVVGTGPYAIDVEGGPMICYGGCGCGCCNKVDESIDNHADALLFAASKDQHAALQATQLLLERLGLESSDEYQRNAAAIAKALGGAA